MYAHWGKPLTFKTLIVCIWELYVCVCRWVSVCLLMALYIYIYMLMMDDDVEIQIDFDLGNKHIIHARRLSNTNTLRGDR